MTARMLCTALASATLALGCVGAASLAAPAAFHLRVQTLTPLLWYQLNEPTGNAINYGSLGPTLNATYNGTVIRGAPTSAGDTGAAFDSADDFLQSLGLSPLTGNPTFSIEVIVRLTNPGAASLWGPFLHWGAGLTGHEVYYSISNNINTRIYAGFYNAGLRTVSDVPTNQWIHAVWTRDGANASNTGSRLFINGRSVAMEIDPALVPGLLNPAQIDVSSTAFHVNRASDSFGSRFFTGALDEIVLYNRRLSPTEIRDNAIASGLAGAITCAGDANGDGAVDFIDLNIVLSQFGQSGEGLDGDLNDDGAVNFLDLNIVLSAFGSSC